MNSKKIYELKGVYGDSEKFTSSYNRMEKMVMFVDNLPTKPKTILDVGCGTGYFSFILSKKFPEAEIIGIDISNIALKLGKQSYSKIIFKKVNAEKKIPFKNNYFDLVISGEHIEHLVDVDSYLEEINRVTKKNGHLIITTPNLASWINRILLLFGRQPWYLEASYRKNLPIFSIFNYRFPINPDSPAVGHLRLFTLNILIKLLREYGFKVIQIRGAKIFAKPILKQIDYLFSYIPDLAFGLVILTQKI